MHLRVSMTMPHLRSRIGPREGLLQVALHAD